MPTRFGDLAHNISFLAVLLSYSIMHRFMRKAASARYVPSSQDHCRSNKMNTVILINWNCMHSLLPHPQLTMLPFSRLFISKMEHETHSLSNKMFQVDSKCRQHSEKVDENIWYKLYKYEYHIKYTLQELM